MRPDFELDQVLSAAISGIPKVAKRIALIPAQGQPRALEAAEKSHLQTAYRLGYEGAEADEWAYTVMVLLRAQTDNASI
jgi:hypothetical protein